VVDEPAVGEALTLRASDADRERVADVLAAAYAEGRLSAVEHDERLSAVYAATTYADLLPTLASLPVPPGTLVLPGTASAAAVAVPAASPGAPARVAPALAAQAAGSTTSVLSGTTRRGRWVVPAQMRALTVLGGIDLDYTDAVLTSADSYLSVVCVLGGVEITVPDGVEVRTAVTCLLGGVDEPRSPALPGSPVLHVSGTVLLGGVTIRRRHGPPGDLPTAGPPAVET